MKATKLEELRRDVERMAAAMMDWTSAWTHADDEAAVSQSGTEIGHRLRSIESALCELAYVLETEVDCMSV